MGIGQLPVMADRPSICAGVIAGGTSFNFQILCHGGHSNGAPIASVERRVRPKSLLLAARQRAISFGQGLLGGFPVVGCLIPNLAKTFKFFRISVPACRFFFQIFRGSTALSHWRRSVPVPRASCQRPTGGQITRPGTPRAHPPACSAHARAARNPRTACVCPG